MFGHILKRQVASALERVCLDGAQSVSWERWTDPVRVEDAVLKPDVLSKLFQLPLEISGGYVGAILVDTAEAEGGLAITVDRLLLVAVKKSDSTSSGSLAASILKPLRKVVAKILPFAKLRVTNLHVRLEDADSHAVLGLACKVLSGTEISGNFRSLGIYFHVNEAELISTTDLSSRTSRFRKLMNTRKQLFHYLVSPFSGNFRVDQDSVILDVSEVVNVTLPRMEELAVFRNILPKKPETRKFANSGSKLRRLDLEKLRVGVTIDSGVQKVVTISDLSIDTGLVKIAEIDISGFLLVRGISIDVVRKLVEIGYVAIDRKRFEESQVIQTEEVFSPRSLGGYDSDWASVAESVFYEARSPRGSPRVSFAKKPLTIPQTEWRATLQAVTVVEVCELRGVELSSEEVVVTAFQLREQPAQEIGLRVDLREKRIQAEKYPEISVHATDVSTSISSVGFSLFARFSEEVSLELEDVTVSQTSVSIVRGELKIMSDLSVVLQSIQYDLSSGSCEQASLTLVESRSIQLLRLSLSDIAVKNKKLSIRQVNLRNLFAAWKVDASYVALKDFSANFPDAITVEAVMAHAGSDMPALVRKLSTIFVPPSTEQYTVENGLWTAVELVALTSGEEKFISRIPPHSCHVLDFPRKFRLLIVKDFSGRVLGTLARGSRTFHTFYYCRPVFGQLLPEKGSIVLKVEFPDIPIPGANFLHRSEHARNFRLDVASLRLVLAPSEQISVHAELDGLTVAALDTLRNSIATRMSLEKLVVVDRSNPADPLLEVGHTEIWKEVDRVFLSIPKTKVHADLEVAEHLNIINSVFQSSFFTLRAFSKPAIPDLVVVKAFELELYAKRLFKVLALDKAPLQLTQCVLREPERLGELAEWYADEISGQWLQLALHIDVYGQPMAVVRNFTGRIKDIFKSLLSKVRDF